MTTPAIPAPGPYSVYTGRVTNWLLVAVSAALLVPLIALGRGSGGPWLGLVGPAALAVVGVVAEVLTGSSVRTAAGPSGVTVRLGVLGVPRLHYAAERIERAEVIHLSPWFVTGGFWWTPRRTCLTVRSGPTLRLVLVGGRTVTVSVPDPHAVVSALGA